MRLVSAWLTRIGSNAIYFQLLFDKYILKISQQMVTTVSLVGAAASHRSYWWPLAGDLHMGSVPTISTSFLLLVQVTTQV